ncbi:hypothetical protein COO91_03577 [Nostoc flagelliforme CCNUN1]|uniref:Uncharacterized protein n=1 Tax=Nostoc flagelliforme CCNUN1 TaxID=2038116 RepID=A0A2K8SQC8_9NOSO|nr:hypothetical protein COO91_03577 [Nostoc flagelliforme CCNUN1]
MCLQMRELISAEKSLDIVEIESEQYSNSLNFKLTTRRKFADFLSWHSRFWIVPDCRHKYILFMG